MKFENDCEQQTLLFKKAMEDLEKESVKVQADLNLAEQAIFVI